MHVPPEKGKSSLWSVKEAGWVQGQAKTKASSFALTPLREPSRADLSLDTAAERMGQERAGQGGLQLPTPGILT